MTKRELKKLGVTYKDTVPVQDGLFERRIMPVLVCDNCNRSWPYPVVKVLMGEAPLPDGFWICPNGCNKPQVGRDGDEIVMSKTTEIVPAAKKGARAK